VDVVKTYGWKPNSTEAGITSSPCRKAIAWVIKNRVADQEHFRGQTDFCKVASSGEFNGYGTKNLRSQMGSNR
jgi:hypothetical protein